MEMERENRNQVNMVFVLPEILERPDQKEIKETQELQEQKEIKVIPGPLGQKETKEIPERPGKMESAFRVWMYCIINPIQPHRFPAVPGKRQLHLG